MDRSEELDATEELDVTVALDEPATLELEIAGALEPPETASLDVPTELDERITITEDVPEALDMTLELEATFMLDVTAAEESPSLPLVPESFAQFKNNPDIANRPKYKPYFDFIIFALVSVYSQVRARNIG